MNIYELSATYQRLQNLIENASADDLEEIEKALDEVSDEIEVKADGYARIIRNLESDIEGFKTAIKSLNDKKTHLENEIKRLKSNLQHGMEISGKTKFKTDLFSFGIQSNGGKAPLKLAENLNIDDLPNELVKIEKTVDNDALRRYIEDTGDLTYGEIAERGTHLSIK